MNTFNVKILASDGAEYQGPCVSLIVPTSDGQYGIMALHSNMISAIVPGKLTYRTPEGVEHILAVSSGLVKAEGGEVLVLVGALVGPLLRTLAVVFMLRLSAALLEPIADGDIVCAIGDFSRTVVLFFITMLCVGTMYFLLIVQVLLVGNLTVLLR